VAGFKEHRLTHKTIDQGKTEKQGETTSEFIASMAGVLVVGLFIITFCLQAFEIPSSSMEDTLLIGDHVFVDRVLEAPRTNWIDPVVPYRQIRHGDIIVFLSPAEPGLYVVKRIMGIPGDHIHLSDGVVYRNGEALTELYAKHNGSYNPYRDNFPEISPGDAVNLTPEWRLTLGSHLANGDLVVPADSYFAMGDNRDVSYDSRYWGFIPRENIIGRPIFIYWSFTTPPDQYLKTSLPERAAFIGHVVLHFFDLTQWRRMFRIVR
jgi:signal peptidase I